MKSLMICLVAFGSLASLPAVSSARDRASEAAAVADVLGLETGSYRVLSATEADQIRGTGGCLSLPCIGLPKIGVNVKTNVNAKVNVLSLVKVNANVKANIGIR